MIKQRSSITRHSSALAIRISFRDAPWPRIVQALVGFFFVAAAYFKLTDSLFGARTATMAQDIQSWLDLGFVGEFYRPFLRWVLPYADQLGMLVIAIQCVFGFLLIYNRKVRWAGYLFLFLQLNIFFSLYHAFETVAFSGTALWLATFYCFRDRMTARQWKIFTWFLIALGAQWLKMRWILGDPWLSSFPVQYAHFQQDVMGVHPAIKQLVMWILDSQIGPWLWTSMWYLQAVILIFMATRFRLYAGSVWLVYLILRQLIWMTALTSEGVLWALLLFTWVTFEYCLEHANPSPPPSPQRRGK